MECAESAIIVYSKKIRNCALFDIKAFVVSRNSLWFCKIDREAPLNPAKAGLTFAAHVFVHPSGVKPKPGPLGQDLYLE